MATSWAGTATIPLLSGVDITQFATLRTIQLNPDKVDVKWNGDGRGPPGAVSQTLASTFTQGYKVAYSCSYRVTGYMYADPGRDAWMNTTLLTSVSSYQTFVPQPTKNYWTYGPDPITQIAVNCQGIPTAITYNFYSNDWTVGHYPSGFTWVMYITVLVAQDCTQSNLKSQLCVDICSADIDQCTQEYANYCLGNNAVNLGDPICTNYYTEYVTAKNSTPEIDRAFIQYCSPYEGFEDLFEGGGKGGITGTRRLKDIQLCACYLTAKDTPDPDATVLYDRYRADLTKKLPSLDTSGIKTQCLVSKCACAKIVPSDISAKTGGCKVPACINDVVINNNGTIKDLNITGSCGGSGNVLYVIAFLLVLLIVIVLVVLYFSTEPSRPLRGKSASYPAISQT